MTSLRAFRAITFCCEDCGSHLIMQPGTEFCCGCGAELEVLQHRKRNNEWSTWYIDEMGSLQGPFDDWDEAVSHVNHYDKMQPSHHPQTGEPMSWTKRELKPEETQELLREVDEAETKDLAARIQEMQAQAWEHGARAVYEDLGLSIQVSQMKKNPFRKGAPF